MGGGNNCPSGVSHSIVSNDQNFIYSLTIYDRRIFYYTLEIDTGNPVFPGIQFGVEDSEGWKVLDLNDYVILVFEQDDGLGTIEYFMSYINPMTGDVTKEFK